MSVTGLAPDGTMTDANGLEAEVKRAMLEQAEQSVLTLDESKLSAFGRYPVAPVARASLVLVDGLEQEAATRLSAVAAVVLGVTR